MWHISLDDDDYDYILCDWLVILGRYVWHWNGICSLVFHCVPPFIQQMIVQPWYTCPKNLCHVIFWCG